MIQIASCELALRYNKCEHVLNGTVACMNSGIPFLFEGCIPDCRRRSAIFMASLNMNPGCLGHQSYLMTSQTSILNECFIKLCKY